MGKIILGGIVAGIITYLWGMFSWMVLPWHMISIHKFKSELIAERMISTNAPEKGIYMLPYAHDGDKEAMEKAHAKAEKGPFAFAVVSPDGTKPMPTSMLVEFLTQVIAGLLMAWLLLQTNISSYIGRLGFVKIVAFTGGVLCLIPNWNWWGFPTSFMIVGLLDLTIGWGLAGLWLAKVTASD